MEPIEGGAPATHRVVTWDVGAFTDPDVGTVDLVAKMQLLVRRLGLELRVENACPELRELIDLAGLSEVLRLVPDQPSR